MKMSCLLREPFSERGSSVGVDSTHLKTSPRCGKMMKLMRCRDIQWPACRSKHLMHAAFNNRISRLTYALTLLVGVRLSCTLGRKRSILVGAQWCLVLPLASFVATWKTSLETMLGWTCTSLTLGMHSCFDLLDSTLSSDYTRQVFIMLWGVLVPLGSWRGSEAVTALAGMARDSVQRSL
jgi:hypothetical protein